jgi:peptidoglycan hydrolase CwlO-like protein
MKKIILTISVSMLLAFSCKSPADKVDDKAQKVEDAKQDLNEAKEDYQKEIEDYRKDINDRIAANDVTITEFNSRIENEKKEAKADYKRQVNELELRNRDLKKRMDEYKADGKDNWHKFKEEFNHDMDELGNSLKDLTRNNVK